MNQAADTLRIRRATLDDAPAYARIMGDDQVYPGLMQTPYTSAEQWHARLSDSLAPGRLDLLLVAERSGAIVGSAGLHPAGLQVRRRHAMTLGISVASAYQRQGVGHALISALIDYADHWAQVLRLELTVYVDNAAAIALYRRHGFEVEGTLRGYGLRRGRFVDAHTMARWHPDPPIAPSCQKVAEHAQTPKPGN